jgi:hypothetical protein
MSFLPYTISTLINGRISKNRIGEFLLMDEIGHLSGYVSLRRKKRRGKKKKKGEIKDVGKEKKSDCRFPMSFLPYTISTLIKGRISKNRIEEFLLMDELGHLSGYVSLRRRKGEEKKEGGNKKKQNVRERK